MCLLKTNVLISCAAIAQLIGTFVFAHAKTTFFQDAGQMPTAAKYRCKSISLSLQGLSSNAIIFFLSKAI